MPTMLNEKEKEALIYEQFANHIIYLVSKYYPAKELYGLESVKADLIESVKRFEVKL